MVYTVQLFISKFAFSILSTFPLPLSLSLSPMYAICTSNKLWALVRLCNAHKNGLFMQWWHRINVKWQAIRSLVIHLICHFTWFLFNTLFFSITRFFFFLFCHFFFCSFFIWFHFFGFWFGGRKRWFMWYTSAYVYIVFTQINTWIC